DVVAGLQVLLRLVDEEAVDAGSDYPTSALLPELLGGRGDRAAGRDDVVDNRDGLTLDREGFRLNLHRVRVDPLFHEEVEWDIRHRRGLLRLANRSLVRGEERVDFRRLEVAAQGGHATHFARGDRERPQDVRVGGDRHRQEFVAIDGDV